MQIVKRLIEQFIPEKYSLSITLDRVERVFSGVVVIEGMLMPGSSVISLHAKYLKIESVTVDGKRADFTLGKHDELSITHKDLNPGKHIVVVTYNSTITDGMHGLYPCYFEHDGVKKQLLV
jgi:aminopeptidase N